MFWNIIVYILIFAWKCYWLTMMKWELSVFSMSGEKQGFVDGRISWWRWSANTKMKSLPNEKEMRTYWRIRQCLSGNWFHSWWSRWCWCWYWCSGLGMETGFDNHFSCNWSTSIFLSENDDNFEDLFPLVADCCLLTRFNGLWDAKWKFLC